MGSASAIADGLVANIGAASVLGAENVSKNTYQKLESSASAACVVAWTRFSDQPQFGAYSAQDIWQFRLQLYLRDTNDPVTLLNRTYTVPQAIIDSIKSDPTIQDTCIKLNNITATQNPGESVAIGGATWLHIPLTVEVVAAW